MTRYAEDSQNDVPNQRIWFLFAPRQLLRFRIVRSLRGIVSTKKCVRRMERDQIFASTLFSTYLYGI